MRAQLELIQTGDDILEIRVESARQAHRLADQLRTLPGIVECVPALRSVSLKSNPLRIDSLMTQLKSLTYPSDAPVSTKDWLEISVSYGGSAGPDLPAVAEQLGLSQNALIDQHCSLLHQVEMIGFTPGFAYLSGLSGHLSVPRLETARRYVPAGSVGISGAYTGLYALKGPGGWPLIGHTDHPLFDPHQDPPFRLLPGQAVRFRAV